MTSNNCGHPQRRSGRIETPRGCRKASNLVRARNRVWTVPAGASARRTAYAARARGLAARSGRLPPCLTPDHPSLSRRRLLSLCKDRPPSGEWRRGSVPEAHMAIRPKTPAPLNAVRHSGRWTGARRERSRPGLAWRAMLTQPDTPKQLRYNQRFFPSLQKRGAGVIVLVLIRQQLPEARAPKPDALSTRATPRGRRAVPAMSCRTGTREGLDSGRYAPSGQPPTPDRNQPKSVSSAPTPSLEVCNFLRSVQFSVAIDTGYSAETPCDVNC